MGKRDKIRKSAYRGGAAALALCILTVWLLGQGAGIGAAFLQQTQQSMISLWCPALSFSQSPRFDFLWTGTARQFPLLYFLFGQRPPVWMEESPDTCREIIRAEGANADRGGPTAETAQAQESFTGRMQVEKGLEERLWEENALAKGTDEGKGEDQNGQQTVRESVGGGQTAGKTEKSISYQWESFQKYDALVKEFYAVDAGTAIDESQLNLQALLSPDLSIEKKQDSGPQILIYHTHSQEGFADSVPGDASTTILGVGEVLAQILREQYGYGVLHHMGQYDVEDRDYAYNNSLPDLEELLEQNPGIEVVIDLHRDEVAQDTRLVTEIDGRPTARFMFFNGLSRTRRHGDIEYLPNENIADNLAFSFQLQVLCNEYYPGLTRRIYLKGYRYNMHVKPRCLLIEMGAQNNTYEECYNACIPLARMLDMELSGVDFGYSG